MKTCPVCALELEDTYLYCPDDGSNLGAMSIDFGSVSNNSSDKKTAGLGQEDEGPGSTVLYCPACAAEYPLTFSSCPVHHVLLTKHPIPKLSNSVPDFAEAAYTAGSHAAVATGIEEQPKREKDLTSIVVLQRPEIHSSKETPRSSSTFEVPESPDSLISDEPVEEWTESDAPSAGVTNPLDYWETLTEAHKAAPDRPGFRVAAVATAILLGILGVIAVSKLVSQRTRRSTSTAQIVSKTQETPQPAPFVATPQEAQEYKEEPPPPQPQNKVEEPRVSEQKAEPPVTKQKAEDAPVVKQKEQARAQVGSDVSSERNAHKLPGAQPVQKSPATAATIPPPTPHASNAPPPALPRGNGEGFDARLIRIRSSRTSSGFRYDLTFSMQEQAGRMAQWQRVLISTHSASGIRHAEAVPFSHRLGPAGALNFTISVELNGRSEADWRGQVVCTTLGWDKQGAPLQASFGANVTP
jgi:outer membrane biosynthesis protein TonB